MYKFLLIFIGYKGGKSQCPTKEDNRVILTKNTVYEFEEEKFTSRSKDGIKGVFTRDRKLPLKNLVILIMSSCSSIQRDLDRFFKSLDNSDFNIRKVTKRFL